MWYILWYILGGSNEFYHCNKLKLLQYSIWFWVSSNPIHSAILFGKRLINILNFQNFGDRLLLSPQDVQHRAKQAAKQAEAEAPALERGVAYFVRRVPKRYAQLDPLGTIWISLRTDSAALAAKKIGD